MKKIVSVLSALLCVFGLSVMSFAVAGKMYSPTDYSDVSLHGSYYSLDTVIKASIFNADQMVFWNDFTSALVGETGAIPLICRGTPGSVYAKSIKFILVTGNYKFSDSSSSGGSVFIVPSKSGETFPCLSVNFSNDGSSMLVSGPSKSAGFPISSSSINGDLLFFGYNKLSGVPSSVWYVDYDGKQIQIQDDLGVDEPDPPSSSSEPEESIPSTPPPPPYNPTIPTIPQGGQYVPYDTSIWNTFLERIKANMGSATNIGFLIFGVSVVWAILIRVVKRFTKAD